MRKIAYLAAEAFTNHKTRNLGNTTVSHYHLSSGDSYDMRLHGKVILSDENGEVFFSLAGWDTPTTRNRINGYFEYNCRSLRVFHDRKLGLCLSFYCLSFYGEKHFPIDSDKWYPVHLAKLQENYYLPWKEAQEKEKENKTKKGNKNSCKR